MQPSHLTNFLFGGGEDLNMFCGHFWAETFGDVFSARISEFCTAIEARLLPAFDDLEGEADQAANAEWDRLSREADPEWVDQAEVAERATEVGVAYYLSMQSVRQALINLSIAALYHLFEQQMLFFHRQQLLHPREENDASLINVRELMSRLALGGVDVHKMRSWPRIQELKAAANVVKHAEGRSADELRQLRPDLFTPSHAEDADGIAAQSFSRVFLPLAGEDIYLSVDDLRTYESALLGFWEELGAAIQ